MIRGRTHLPTTRCGLSGRGPRLFPICARKKSYKKGTIIIDADLDAVIPSGGNYEYYKRHYHISF